MKVVVSRMISKMDIRTPPEKTKMQRSSESRVLPHDLWTGENDG